MFAPVSLTRKSREALTSITKCLTETNHDEDKNGNWHYDTESSHAFIETLLLEHKVQGFCYIDRYRKNVNILNRDLILVPITIITGSPSATPVVDKKRQTENQIALKVGELVHTGNADSVVLTPELDILIVEKATKEKA